MQHEELKPRVGNSWQNIEDFAKTEQDRTPAPQDVVAPPRLSPMAKRAELLRLNERAGQPQGSVEVSAQLNLAEHTESMFTEPETVPLTVRSIVVDVSELEYAGLTPSDIPNLRVARGHNR